MSEILGLYLCPNYQLFHHNQNLILIDQVIFFWVLYLFKIVHLKFQELFKGAIQSTYDILFHFNFCRSNHLWEFSWEYESMLLSFLSFKFWLLDSKFRTSGKEILDDSGRAGDGGESGGACGRGISPKLVLLFLKSLSSFLSTGSLDCSSISTGFGALLINLLTKLFFKRQFIWQAIRIMNFAPQK